EQLDAAACARSTEPSAACDTPADSARFVRLTHAQWENTTQDLFRFAEPLGLSKAFTGDPPGGVFDSNSRVLAVGPTLWDDYQRAAEELARRVADDDEALARILPPLPTGDPAAGAQAFIQSFGARAHRRPLTREQVDGYLNLFEQGPELTGVTDPFKAGVRVVLQAMLQSPLFLYRVESEADAQGGSIPLSPYELASRLSYALWNTMPDDGLMAAASDGALDTPEGLEAQARRLLEHARATTTVRQFHHQLFKMGAYQHVRKDSAAHPGVPAAPGASMLQEAQLFLDDVVFTREEGLRSILMSPRTFVNRELAALYGLPGTFDDSFRPVELDPTERAGLLTQSGFLATYAHGEEPDSILRGVFVNLRLLCVNLSMPDIIPPLPGPSAGQTNRERVERHTGAGTCGAACHGTLINPAGFAFESFDAFGRVRATDNGIPVNAADRYALDNGQMLTYDGAVEFSRQVSEADQTHACYVRHWLEYAYGRDVTEADANLIKRLAALSRADQASVKDIILSLVTSRAFRLRAVEVTP
ncbi:MAG TPA: DUF1592 domain-containing protein, partial [Myxococcaceae bacterium]|nr:DUF1592 domain-containing protein [Myxococcaceae bacterium]